MQTHWLVFFPTTINSIGFEFLGFIGAWFSLCWCCGAGAMKLDVYDSDDDEHEWHDEEHENVAPQHLHSV